MSELPPPFTDLEPLAARWSLPTERARNAARRAATMADLTLLYNSMLPRMNDIAATLSQAPVDRLTQGQTRLLWLAMSFMEAAMAVELFKEPDERDAFPAERYTILEAE